MHLSSSLIGKKALEVYSETSFTKILEVGSLDVNGSLRDHNVNNLEWVGVDFEEGKGVDVVLTDPYAYPFESETFDMVMASSVFEHSEFFWVLFMEMVRLTKPGGVIYVCAPSNGVVHRYPVDVYRFYPDSAKALANFAKREGVEVGLEETFIYRGVDGGWCDWVAVFRKGKVSRKKRKRIAESFDTYFFEDASASDVRQSFTVPDQDLIGELRGQLASSEEQLRMMRSSRAWRFTAPVRRMVGGARRVFRVSRRQN